MTCRAGLLSLLALLAGACVPVSPADDAPVTPTGPCDVPGTLEFGAVVPPSSAARVLVLGNDEPTPRRATLRVLEAHPAFVVHPAALTVPPGGAEVPLLFVPTGPGEARATLGVQTSPGCAEREVQLLGTGVARLAEWTPSLDFGRVAPGALGERTVTFSNSGGAPLTVENLAVDPPGAFTLVTPPSTLTLPAARRGADGRWEPATASVALTFRPSAATAYAGTLRALVQGEAVAIPLSGSAGGARLEARPETVDFGQLGWSSGGPTAAAQRWLALANVTDAPLPLHRSAFWMVAPANARSHASEVCVGAVDESGACTGALPAGFEAGLAPGATLDLAVRVTPDGPGEKAWLVQFFSAGEATPSLVVPLRADVVASPPCVFTLSPQTLAFGTLDPGRRWDLTVSVTNRATTPGEVCVVNGVDLEPGTSPVFSLPGGPLAGRALQPGERMDVTVRATATADATGASPAGNLALGLPSGGRPLTRVPLSLDVTAPCLVLAPNDLDFGTVRQGCSSSNRTFQLYNICSAPITLTGFSMLQAAGEPAGGPNCAGPSPCPEFHVASTPVLPSGGLVLPPAGPPVQFQLKYRPINLGADTGAFAITFTGGVTQAEYLVTLRGNGDVAGVNTDTFRQDPLPQVDLLLLIDDTVSMADDQANLAYNLDQLRQYLERMELDFHVAVATTDEALGGALRELPGAVPGCDALHCRVLSPATPNLQAAWQAGTNVGAARTGPSACLATAAAALSGQRGSDPLQNGGFLRSTAPLSVICITDGPEESSTADASSLATLQALKTPASFSWSVVGPFGASPPAACVYDPAGNDGRHAAAVARTYGVSADICASDWERSFEALGRNAWGRRSTFYLTATPAPLAALLVAIDGVPVAPQTPAGDDVWTYDRVTNSVTFTPGYVPRPGTTLTITYTVGC